MRWRKLIKDNQKNFSRLHMLIDVFVIAASYALAWLFRDIYFFIRPLIFIHRCECRGVVSYLPEL